MSRREFLEEDLRLIRHYFPGAKPVSLRTPFDLTLGPVNRTRLLGDDCTEQPDSAHPDWQGDLLWSR